MAPVKDYTPEQMGRALEAVRRGEPVATAAKKFGVPRCTLRNKFIGKSPVVCSMGPPTILRDTEEKLLVNWIIAMSERHCPVGKDQLLDSVQKIVNTDRRSTPFTDNRPGKKWFKAFLERHPELTVRVSQNLTKTRDNVTEEQITAWFSEVEQYFKDNNLVDVLKDPKRVFNTDESAFFLNPKGDRVLVRRGEKNVYKRSGNEKENLTVLVTANAAGQLAPPMIVFTYERVPGYIAKSINEHWGIGRSDSGWMCGRTFFEYITNVFHPWLITQDIQLPIIFFLDGHASHLTLHLAEFCAHNQIELIALYPNSTHLLQPMDIAVFRPLKVFYKKNINKWKTENLGHEVKKENFGPILEASLKGISTECIKNGFRAGGLHPFGPDYVDFSKLNKKNRPETNSIASVSSDKAEDYNFLTKLEAEVVNIYTTQKLDLFKECFYKNKENLQDHLPNEDLSLYIIWAKYKHKCHIDGNEKATNEINTECTNLANIPSPSLESELITNQKSQSNDISPSVINDQQTDSQRKNCPIDDYSKATELDRQLESEKNDHLASLQYCTPTKTTASTSSFASYMLNTNNIQVPSPFKKALFWPEPEIKKRRLTKEKIPSVITSKAWREYSEKKQLEKKTKEDEKEQKKLERQKKKQLREESTINKKVQKKKGSREQKNKRRRIANNLTKTQNKKRKLPKESSSSDDATDSDVTYAETDESENSDMEIQYLEQQYIDTEIEEIKETKIGNPDSLLCHSKSHLKEDNTKINVSESIRTQVGKSVSLQSKPDNTDKSSRIKILSEVAVNVVLDEKSGKFITLPVTQDLKGGLESTYIIKDTKDQENITEERERVNQAWGRDKVEQTTEWKKEEIEEQVTERRVEKRQTTKKKEEEKHGGTTEGREKELQPEPESKEEENLIHIAEGKKDGLQENITKQRKEYEQGQSTGENEEDEQEVITDGREKREQGLITKGRNTGEPEKTKEGSLEVETEADIIDDFLINDAVLVRYYQRKQWKYYIGFVQNIITEDNERFYTVKFLKTLRKPELKFVLAKRDQDLVPSSSIVKKIKLLQSALSNEYHLCDNSDQNYF